MAAVSTTSLEEYWFSHENFWFDAGPSADVLLMRKFENYEPTSQLEYIILNDQIQRHIARCKKIPYDEVYSDQASKAAISILDTIDSYKPNEQVFILLAIRHTRTRKNIQLCLDIIRDLIDNDGLPVNKYYRRFHNVTVQVMSEINEPTMVIPDSKEFVYCDLLCKSCKFDNGDMFAGTRTSKLVSVVPMLTLIGGQVDKSSKCIISLSGGVDSMVCLNIAVMLGLKPIALFINYNNRDESSDEVQFIAWYCHMLQVPFYCRSINEISRSTWNRSFYETHTRVIRFRSYQWVIEAVGLDLPVILGHNKDDVEENIITNLKNGCSLENLKGMAASHIEDSTKIIRPLLEFDKTWIFKFAHMHNIPYLKNSTPAWSERGKLREHVISHIPPAVMHGLILHANTVRSMHSYIKHITDSYKIIECSYNDWKYFQFDINGYECSVFWECMLMRAIKYRIGRKNLENLMYRLKLNTKKYNSGRFELHDYKPAEIQITTGTMVRIYIRNGGAQYCRIYKVITK